MIFGKVDIKRTILDYLALSVACFIFALAWKGFMIPNGMSAGGVMGLCTVMEFATKGLIAAQYSYFGINALLVILAVIAFGIGFGFKTIWCIFLSSVAMEVLDFAPGLQCLPDHFFYVRETVLIPVIAGVLEAVGIGLVIRYGGSTGGTDIIALMIHKYWPVSLSTVFVISDLMVVALLLLLPDKAFTDMVYGIEEIVTFSLIIDLVVGGRRSSYQLLVFSERYREIADYIISEMNRGVTILKAQGWFTKKNKDVLLIVISKKQFPSLSKVIKELDPRAFISVSPTASVYGEGFDEIKVGLSHKKKHKNHAD